MLLLKDRSDPGNTLPLESLQGPPTFLAPEPPKASCLSQRPAPSPAPTPSSWVWCGVPSWWPLNLSTVIPEACHITVIPEACDSHLFSDLPLDCHPFPGRGPRWSCLYLFAPQQEERVLQVSWWLLWACEIYMHRSKHLTCNVYAKLRLNRCHFYMSLK